MSNLAETTNGLVDQNDLVDIIYPQDTVTRDLRKKVVSKAILWAAKARRPVHWRTSFPFTEVEDISAVGISFDMFRPMYHVNHLQLAPEEAQNSYGSLAIQSRAFGKLVTKSPLVLVDVPLAPGITAGDIIDLVTVQNQMQNYVYHPDASGCLYWQLMLLNSLCERHWCSPGFQEILRDHIVTIQKQDNVYSNAIVWPPVAGTFYAK